MSKANATSKIADNNDNNNKNDKKKSKAVKFTPEELIPLVEKDNEDGTFNTITFTKKEETAPSPKGKAAVPKKTTTVKYFIVTAKVGDKEGWLRIIMGNYNGFIEDETNPDNYVEISSDVADQNKDSEDPRAQYGLSFSTTASKGRNWYRLMAALQTYFERYHKKFVSEKVIKATSRACALVSAEYSDDCPAEDKRGQTREDPVTRCKFSFEPYPASHKRGGYPRCVIYDFEKIEVGDNDNIVPVPATVLNPKTKKDEPVDVTNVHLFLRDGAKIVDGDINMSSANDSQFGFSWQKQAESLTVIQSKKPVFVKGARASQNIDDDSKKKLVEKLKAKKLASANQAKEVKVEEKVEKKDKKEDKKEDESDKSDKSEKSDKSDSSESEAEPEPEKPKVEIKEVPKPTKGKAVIATKKGSNKKGETAADVKKVLDDLN